MAGKNTHVSAADHQRITAAIKAAEQKTDGEIFAVVAHSSDNYHFVAVAFAASWSLVLGLVVGAFLSWRGIHYDPLLMPLAQVIAFAALMAASTFYPRFRMALVPKGVAHGRASANAMRQFLSHNIHTTQQRSGVLLFISLAERYAEVVADQGIDSVVDQGEWDDIVGLLIDGAASDTVADGFVQAVEASGALLAQHFPPTAGESNELDDRLVEI